MRRAQAFLIQGMNRDMSVSQMDPKYAYEIKNMRLYPTTENTLLSLVNEKGNQALAIYTKQVTTDGSSYHYRGDSLYGIPIGQAILGDTLVLFMTECKEEDNSDFGVDTICKYTIENVAGTYRLIETLLYNGNLGFQVKSPIETLVYFENEELQKVYWTDGLNQPRMINIAATEDVRATWTDTQFDFVRELQLQENVTIRRNEISGGLFAPGTLQYVLTYFDKYGQETNPFYISTLFYTSYHDRGGSPEDSVSNSFDIYVTNVDTHFDYLRIYSILRTSIDATPECKKVVDIATSKINDSKTAWQFTELTDSVDKWFDDGYSYSNLSEYIHFYNSFYASGAIIQDITQIQQTPTSSTGEQTRVEVSGDTTTIYLDSKVYTKAIFGKNYEDYEADSTVTYIEWSQSVYYQHCCAIVINAGGSITFRNYDNAAPDMTVGYITGHQTGIIAYTDTGTTGESVDPTELLYVGGRKVTFGTMAQKDNTLFLGDIQLQTPSLKDIKETSGVDIKALLQKIASNNNYTAFRFRSDTKRLSYPDAVGYYPYENQLKYSAEQIKTFKYLEWYRFGLIFQHKTGTWSEVVWLGDMQNTCKIDDVFYTNDPIPLTTAELVLRPLSNDAADDKVVIQALLDAGYVRVKPVVVYPDIHSRECICQGVLCPTVFNIEDRYTNSPFVQSSWFVRPNAPFDYNSYFQLSSSNNYRDGYKQTSREYRGREQGRDIILSDNLPNNAWTPLIGTDELYSRVGIMLNDTGNAVNGNVDDTNHVIDNVNKGTWAEFRHLYPIPGNLNKRAEIECLIEPPAPAELFRSSTAESVSTTSWVNSHSEYYYVDQSIFTMHSPEIEFDDRIQVLDTSGLKLRITGIVPITATVADIDIQTSTPAMNFHEDYDEGPEWNKQEKVQWSGDMALGYYKESISVPNGFNDINTNTAGSSHYGWKGLLSGVFWFDETYGSSRKNDSHNMTAFVVFPWQRNGSLNTQQGADEDGYIYAELKQKYMSNLRFSYRTQYLDKDNMWYALDESDNNSQHTGISGVTLFNSEEMTLVKIPAPENSDLPDLVYYGNVDKLITITPSVTNQEKTGADDDDHDEDYARGYPLIVTGRSSGLEESSDDDTPDVVNSTANASTFHQMFGATYRTMFTVDGYGCGQGSQYKHHLRTDFCYSSDPVRIKYKSTPHAVIALNYSPPSENVDSDGTTGTRISQNILPSIDGINQETTLHGTRFYWDSQRLHNSTAIVQDNIKVDDYTPDTFPKEIEGVEGIQYGWLWLGELYQDNVINRFGGDSEAALAQNIWVACGESVPLTSDKTVDIQWTEGDTYYQRYDHIKTYPFTTEDTNSVTDIISFMCETRINLDGRYDRNRGLTSNLVITPENFNKVNMVYSQENNFFTYHTLDEDLINLDNFHNCITWTKTKTAGELVDTWTNITLASTLDLDGDRGNVTALRRLSNDLICFQDTGVSTIKYNENIQLAASEGVPVELANSGKVDGKNYLSTQIGCTNKWSIVETGNGLYFVDNLSKNIYIYNGQFTSLSSNNGFSAWINNELSDTQDWNSVDFEDFISYYDKVNNDVLFINKNNCLAFSELLGAFSSFYDYENTPYMAAIGNKFLAVKRNDNDKYGIWLQYEGEYNSFFGNYKPFWFTVIANDGLITDKTFDNIEFRADTFDSNGEYLPWETFDYLEIKNEYQLGSVNLTKSHGHPAWIKKKFKIWRANIPRANSNGRDRIRNPWAYITLSKKSNDNHKTILRDLQVVYFDNTPVGLQTSSGE